MNDPNNDEDNNGNNDDDNYSSDKELNLDEDESEDEYKYKDEYEDEDEEKYELMLDDTIPKAPVSHCFLILALLSDFSKHLVRTCRETQGPQGQQVAKDIAAPQISIGRKHKHSSPTAPSSRKCSTHPF